MNKANEVYTIHPHGGGVQRFTRAELIANAEQQRREGIAPHYAFNLGHGETTRPGYLVYSTWYDGCAVVILDGYAEPGIITGVQGDFVFTIDGEGVSA